MRRNPTPLEEELRDRVRRLITLKRQFDQMDPREFGVRMAKELGDDTWDENPPNLVYKLESGAKAPTLSVVYAASAIQKQPVEWYFTADPDELEKAIELAWAEVKQKVAGLDGGKQPRARKRTHNG